VLDADLVFEGIYMGVYKSVRVYVGDGEVVGYCPCVI
jgi:hypothetical protein